MRFELWRCDDVEHFGMIVPCKSGVVFTNQVGGVARFHPEVEGQAFIEASVFSAARDGRRPDALALLGLRAGPEQARHLELPRTGDRRSDSRLAVSQAVESFPPRGPRVHGAAPCRRAQREKEVAMTSKIVSASAWVILVASTQTLFGSAQEGVFVMAVGMTGLIVLLTAKLFSEEAP